MAGNSGTRFPESLQPTSINSIVHVHVSVNVHVHVYVDVHDGLQRMDDTIMGFYP